MQTDQTRLLALALLEIRTLLADYLGSDVDAPMSVRVAAHMPSTMRRRLHTATLTFSSTTQPGKSPRSMRFLVLRMVPRC